MLRVQAQSIPSKIVTDLQGRSYLHYYLPKTAFLVYPTQKILNTLRSLSPQFTDDLVQDSQGQQKG